MRQFDLSFKSTFRFLRSQRAKRQKPTCLIAYQLRRAKKRQQSCARLIKNTSPAYKGSENEYEAHVIAFSYLRFFPTTSRRFVLIFTRKIAQRVETSFAGCKARANSPRWQILHHLFGQDAQVVATLDEALQDDVS